MLKYFTFDQKSLKLDIIGKVLGHNFSTKLSYLLLIGHSVIACKYLPEGRIQFEHFAFVGMVYLLTDMVPQYALKSLTFAEAFTLSTVVVVYASFSVRQLLYPVASSVGSTSLNAAMFLPWAFLLLGIFIWWILGRLLNSALAFTVATVVVMGCIATLLTTRPDLLARTVQVVMEPQCIQMTLYLAVTLIIGLAILFDVSHEPHEQVLKLGIKLDNMYHRKLFHVLGLLLYTPMHASIFKDRSMFEFLVLSQNLVTVLMIYIELTRFANLGNSVGVFLTNVFSRFADTREHAEKRLLLTHLYLLIGLGLATNITFILLNGGFADGVMTVFAFSGVAFLGILDTLAAVIGKTLGSTPWRENAHKKTFEGTTYSFIFTVICYYVFCARVYDQFCTMFLIVFFATFFTGILEGWTSQFDNLVCPIFYFIALHQLYDYFMSFEPPTYY